MPHAAMTAIMDVMKRRLDMLMILPFPHRGDSPVTKRLCYHFMPCQATTAAVSADSVELGSAVRVGIDISCLLARPLTGVGYATLHLLNALAPLKQLEIRLFASSVRVDPAALDFLQAKFPLRMKRWPTRLKNHMWARLEWPPIERWLGPIDVAHGTFHLLPATRSARRMVTVHDLYGLRHPEMASSKTAPRQHRLMLNHAARRADMLLAVSEHTRRECISMLGAPEEKCKVVHWGVDHREFAGDLDVAALDAIKNRLGVSGDYLIYLGTVEPRKNLPRLIQAYAQVRARRADCPALVLAGGLGWQYEDVFRTIAALNLEAVVVHAGYLSRREAMLLLRGARGSVYMSLYEGFGLPVLESMSAGVPVAASDSSAIPEVLGNTGLKADPINIESIAAAVEQLVYDETGARARAAAALERARQFTWEKTAQNVAELYQALARGSFNA
jgi:glycosyltransferase involved in cell wall biosynthesis